MVDDRTYYSYYLVNGLVNRHRTIKRKTNGEIWKEHLAEYWASIPKGMTADPDIDYLKKTFVDKIR